MVRTDKNYLGTQDNPLPIIPGMVATVEVLTGKKSVLDYLCQARPHARRRGVPRTIGAPFPSFRRICALQALPGTLDHFVGAGRCRKKYLSCLENSLKPPVSPECQWFPLVLNWQTP